MVKVKVWKLAILGREKVKYMQPNLYNEITAFWVLSILVFYVNVENIEQ